VDTWKEPIGASNSSREYGYREHDQFATRIYDHELNFRLILILVVLRIAWCVLELKQPVSTISGISSTRATP